MKNLITTGIMGSVFKSPIVYGIVHQARTAVTKKVTEWIMSNGIEIIKNELMVTMRFNQNDSGRTYWDFLRWLTPNVGRMNRTLNGSMVEGKYYNLTNVPVFFRYKGYNCFAYKRYPRKDEYGQSGPSIIVNMLGRDAKILEQLHEEMCQRDEEDDEINVYRSAHGGTWQHVCEVPPRNFDSVILRKDIKEGIIKKINDWIESEDFYKSRGLAYKLGLIFKGLPGTGKTSIIKAIASSLGYDLYLLNLDHVTDQNLIQCLQRAGENSIIVIEEFDTCGVVAKRAGLSGIVSEASSDEEDMDEPSNRRDVIAQVREMMMMQKQAGRSEESGLQEFLQHMGIAGPGEDSSILAEKSYGLTLGGLLTAFDGLIPLNNRIIIMTTNIMDDTKFDPALLRKGRIDGIFEIPYLEQAEIEEYIKYMFPRHEVPTGLKFKPIAGCNLHGAFLDNKFDFDNFIAEIPQVGENTAIESPKSDKTTEKTKDETEGAILI